MSLQKKIILIASSLVYCSSVLAAQGSRAQNVPRLSGSMSMHSELFGIKSPDGIIVPSADGYDMVRRPGFWTTQEQCCLSYNYQASFFNKSTNNNDQRENWYELSPYVAEPLCAVANVPLLYLAYQFKDERPIAARSLACAGITSIVSHTIPKHWLAAANRIGSCCGILGVAYDCSRFSAKVSVNTMSHFDMIFWLVGAAMGKCCDWRFAYTHYLTAHGCKLLDRSKLHSIVYALWRLSLPVIAHMFLVISTP